MTKAEVECMHAESSADYVDPAEDAASCFDECCAEKFKKGAAEHDNWLLNDTSAQGILVSVPAYNAQAAVCSALMTWVSVVHEHVKASVMYNSKHTQACAEVLPILDQIMCDANKISCDCLCTKSTHWCDHVFVPLLSSGEHSMDENFAMNGDSYKKYGECIGEIAKQLNSYLWLASWLCG